MEEFTLVGYEMIWTVKYFLHQSRVWEDRGIAARHADKPGAVAYAARKAAMWKSVATTTDRRFCIVNDAYKSVV